MKPHGQRWHLWAFLAGCSALLGLALTSPPLAAQGKSPDNPKSKGPKNPDPKAEPAKPKAPEVRDVIVGTTGGIENIKVINDTLEKAWVDNKVEPSERASDYEFIRRASLDIIGRIARVKEIERFMSDPPERRRSMLIERLLGLEKGPDQQKYADEYAEHWATIWTNMLLTRSGTAKMYQTQMRDWLMDQFLEKKADSSGAFSSYPDWSKIVTELLTATGDTNENGAVNYILAHLGDAIPGNDKKRLIDNGAFDMVPVTSRTTRLFLGLRTQCVQCHDHPFNDEWGQHHFWGVNAFFRQADAPKGRLQGMMGKGKDASPQRNLVDNTDFNVKGIVPYERRTGVFLYTDPTFLDGKKMKLGSDSTRRKELAKFITKSPYFAQSYINRTWGHFFGRGLTKDAVDDFGEHNPIIFPELLETLSSDWAAKYDHNPKVLIRWICNSKAYGLSSVATPKNDKVEDEVFFPRMLLKAMTPEQLFESLMVATEAKVGQTKESKAEKRQEWLDRLIQNFGDDEGNEGSYSGTVVQALLLMNGRDINDAINDQENGTVAHVIKTRKASPTALKDAMKDLYLAALNRPPRADEYARVLSKDMVRLPRASNPGDGRFPANAKAVEGYYIAFYQDMFWALLNSNEFILNH